MKKICTVVAVVLMLAWVFPSNAPTANADDGGLVPYVNQFRNDNGQPSLAVNQQMQDQAQAWASRLASTNADASVDPNVFTPAPSGWEGGTQVPGVGENGADYLFVEGGLEKSRSATLNDPAWNAVGIGTAKSPTGKVYVVVNLATIKVRTAAPAPAPAPVPPVPAPAPVLPVPVIAEPVPVEPVPAAEPVPMEAAPVVPEATKAEPEKPRPETTATLSPTATPSAVSAIPSATPSSPAAPTLMDSPHAEPLAAHPVVERTPMLNMFGISSLVSLAAGLAGLRQWRMKLKQR